MNIHSLYSKVRRPLAHIWLLAFFVTFLLSFVLFFQGETPKIQSSNPYYLFVFVVLSWAFTAMAARMVTLVRYKNHLDEDIRLRWLNVFSLVLFAVMYVAISATPSSPDRTFEGVFATLRSIQIFAIGIWTYGAVILDLSEIFL